MNLTRHNDDDEDNISWKAPSSSYECRDVGGFVMLVSYVNGCLDIELQRDLLSNNDYQYFTPLEFSTVFI